MLVSKESTEEGVYPHPQVENKAKKARDIKVKICLIAPYPYSSHARWFPLTNASKFLISLCRKTLVLFLKMVRNCKFFLLVKSKGFD